MTEKQEYETDYMDNIICPYCGEKNAEGVEYEVFIDDKENIEDTETYCDDCGKEFSTSRLVTAKYTTKKIGES